jgi:hypothetical protein
MIRPETEFSFVRKTGKLFVCPEDILQPPPIPSPLTIFGEKILISD